MESINSKIKELLALYGYDERLAIPVDLVVECMISPLNIFCKKDVIAPKSDISSFIANLEKATIRASIDNDHGRATIEASKLSGKSRIEYVRNRLSESFQNCVKDEVSALNMRALAMVVMNNLSLLEQPDKTQIKVEVCEHDGKMLATPANEYTKFLFNVVYG